MQDPQEYDSSDILGPRTTTHHLLLLCPSGRFAHGGHSSLLHVLHISTGPHQGHMVQVSFDTAVTFILSTPTMLSLKASLSTISSQPA